MACKPVRPEVTEVVQRICGGLELARDITERSATMYLAASDAPDHAILDELAFACALLKEAVEALESGVREPRLRMAR